jgi:hypothetical protein
LRFDDGGIARFGNATTPGGYTYFSSGVPRGERRDLRKPAPQSARAEPPEDEPTEVGWNDEPLPLDILFKQVPKAVFGSPASTSEAAPAVIGSGHE